MSVVCKVDRPSAAAELAARKVGKGKDQGIYSWQTLDYWHSRTKKEGSGSDSRIATQFTLDSNVSFDGTDAKVRSTGVAWEPEKVKVTADMLAHKTDVIVENAANYTEDTKSAIQGDENKSKTYYEGVRLSVDPFELQAVQSSLGARSSPTPKHTTQTHTLGLGLGLSLGNIHETVIPIPGSSVDLLVNDENDSEGDLDLDLDLNMQRSVSGSSSLARTPIPYTNNSSSGVGVEGPIEAAQFSSSLYMDSGTLKRMGENNKTMSLTLPPSLILTNTKSADGGDVGDGSIDDDPDFDFDHDHDHESDSPTGVGVNFNVNELEQNSAMLSLHSADHHDHHEHHEPLEQEPLPMTDSLVTDTAASAST